MRYCGGPETNQEGLSLFLPLLVCLLHSGPSLTNGQQQQQQQLVSPTERRTHTHKYREITTTLGHQVEASLSVRRIFSERIKITPQKYKTSLTVG